MSQQGSSRTAGWGDGAASAVLAESPRVSLMRGLSCPACGRDVDLAVSGRGAAPSELTCAHCGRRWPIRQRTPIFLPPAHGDAIPSGARALLHAPDVERWDTFRHAVEHADPALYAEVFDFARDDWRFLLPLPTDARVLVIGGGWGRLASSLAAIAERVYAVDRDEAQARFVNIRAFTENRPNLLAACAGIEGLPFARGSFDLVVVANPGAIGPRDGGRASLPSLVRLRAFLAPGGTLLLRDAPAARRGIRGSAARRWQGLLHRAGFTRTEEMLAFPGPVTCSHVLYCAPDTEPGPTLKAFVGRCVETKSLPRKAARRLAMALPLPGATRWLVPGRWHLATCGEHSAPAVLDRPSLPPGPWNVVASRGRGSRAATASFVAVDPKTAQPRFRVTVARDAEAEEAVERESRALEYLQRALPPEMRTTIPRPLDRFAVHGHLALAQVHLEGRTLLSLLQETPPARRAELAADILSAATLWLARLHHETAREVVLTAGLLERLLLNDLDRVLDRCAIPEHARGLLEAAGAHARGLVGERIPLVCAHGRYQADSVLVDRGTLRVVDWDQATPEHLPLGDLYDMVHSVASLLGGTGEGQEGIGEMLRVAYGGRGTYSRAVALALDGYCTRLGIRQEWGQSLLPLLMARSFLLHAERRGAGSEQRRLQIGIRFLETPTRFPVAFGLRAAEAPKGIPG